MNIVMQKVADLVPYEKNPRFNDGAVKYVAESIKQFGFKVPIIVDKDNVIIAGHTRLKAALELGIEEVPTIIASDLNDKQVAAFRLADNKVSEFSYWDEDLLLEELKELESDFNFKDLGFDDLDIFEETVEPHDDDFDFDESMKKDLVTKRGDLYVLGNHRLLCGDSTNKKDIDYLLDGKQVDLFITDPPYNVDYEGEAGSIENDAMPDKEFRKFLATVFKNVYEALKPGCSFYIWFADKKAYWVLGAMMDAGFEVRQHIYWKKNALVLGRSDYQFIHEPCLYGWKEGAAHQWYNDRSQVTVFEFDKPLHNDIHPTMKPVPLWAYTMGNSSKKGDICLDLFAGSGTTIITAQQIGRIGYCMELEPKFCDSIVRRYIQEVGSSEGCYLIRDGVEQPLPDGLLD